MFSAELKDMESPTFKSLSRGLELEVMYVGIFLFFKTKENYFLKGSLMGDSVVEPRYRR